MSLFNWFSGKPNSFKDASTDSTRPQQTSKPAKEPDKPLAPAGKPPVSQDTRLVDRKIRRHARREQLYLAIRECMTRAGVLSPSYKFKVLSLDHQGDQFLVMMDVAPGLGGQAEKLTEIETLLVSTATSRFSIYVTSVYWRTDNRPVAVNAVNFGVSQPAAQESELRAFSAAKKSFENAAKTPGTKRHDPIHDDEPIAFKQVLVAASAQHAAPSDGTGKNRSGLRSFTLITGFEDTEMPESSAAPALSATQYGELN